MLKTVAVWSSAGTTLIGLITACSSGGSSHAVPTNADGSVPPAPGTVSVLPDGGTSLPAVGSGASSHTPQSGCREGFASCTSRAPGVCAHVQDDYEHCGACDRRCQEGSCIAGKCEADSGVCRFGALCGPDCIAGRHKHVDHCGSCFNRCAGNSVCVGGECVTGQGDGSSCASPLIWDVEAEEHAGFRLDFAPGSTFVHPCGPLTAIPTKWFRFTSPKSGTNVSVDSTIASDRFVMTVFSSAACDESVVVACSNDKVEPSVDLPNSQGKTYFVAVGAVSVTQSGAASVRVDH